MRSRMFATLSETFWILVLAVVVLFAFFVALGAFQPGEVLVLTLVVAVLVGAGFGAIVGLDRQFGGKSDAFVAKINGAGTEVLYCTYIGGAGNDFGLGIIVDDSGAAYVTGETASDAASLPPTRGADPSSRSPPWRRSRRA